MFLPIHFYLLEMPKMIPRGRQEAPKGAQDRPTGVQEGPKTVPGRPQDSSKTAPRRPKSRPRAPFTMLGPPSDVYDGSGCSKKPSRGSQDTPKHPPRTSPRGQDGFKGPLTFNISTPRGGVSSKICIYIYIYELVPKFHNKGIYRKEGTCTYP